MSAADETDTPPPPPPPPLEEKSLRKKKKVTIEGDDGNNDEKSRTPLYQSTRLKGYLTLILASAINFNSAVQSQETISMNVVPAQDDQQNFAVAAAILSLMISIFVILLHLNPIKRLTKYWEKWFQPQESVVELLIISLLVIWWIVVTWIQTSVQGIAGDGKGQYNLYFSTWACLLTCIWTLERWLVARGLASFRGFLASWPNRAPGFIAIFLFSTADLLSVLNLYLQWEDAYNDANYQDDDSSGSRRGVITHFENIGDGQWEWLLFVTAFTIPCAVGFILAELCRGTVDGQQQEKREWETILEGFVLCLLVLAWIPTVIVATTPGGVASLVGNSYMFTWGATVFVLETSVWWIHDWRKRIHTILEQEQETYEKIQQRVLEQSRANQLVAARGGGGGVEREGGHGEARRMNDGEARRRNSSSALEPEEDMVDDISEYSGAQDDAHGLPDVVGT